MFIGMGPLWEMILSGHIFNKSFLLVFLISLNVYGGVYFNKGPNLYLFEPDESEKAQVPTPSGTSTTTVALADLNDIGTLVYWWNAQNVTGTITSWNQLDATETETLASSGSINIPSLNTSDLNGYNTGTFDASNSEASESNLSPTMATAYILVVFQMQATTAARTCVIASNDRFNDYSLSVTGSAGSSKLASVQVGSNQASWVDGTAAADTSWHYMIFVVRNAGNEEVWIDGASSKDIDTAATGAAQVQSIRIGACGDMDAGGDGGGGAPDIIGDDVKIAEVAMWSALDMTGNGTGDEYAEIKTYISSKYGL